jgi:hypothetical protein
MRALLGASAHEPAAVAIAGALALLTIGVLSGHGAGVLAVLLAVVTLVVLTRRTVIGWDRLVATILLIVLLIPIGRYQLPSSLPFNLELYRVVVALIVLLWFAALLVDPRVQLARTPFDRPLLLIAVCVLGSEATNLSRVSAYGTHVVKALMFFLSFVLVFYLTATTIRRRSSALFLLKILTVGGAVIGVFAAIEERTHYNVFNHLHVVLPFLTYDGSLDYLKLGQNIRAIGPAQQPIALGAAMIVTLPLSLYFARTSGRRWWVVGAGLLLGAFASGSRTAIVMLGVEALVFLWLKPTETKRQWPLLLPALVIVQLALPGAIGGLKNAFSPQGGLIAQQSKFEADYNPLLAGGRVRLIKPMLTEAAHKPLFGEGYGTRITGFDEPDRNAPILDDQWLNNALDVGFVGLAAWAWLMLRSVRTLARASRAASRSGDDWLFVALAASIAGFAVGMFTYDAFDFTQVTFIFWIVLGLSAAILRITKLFPEPAEAASARSRPARAPAQPIRLGAPEQG